MQKSIHLSFEACLSWLYQKPREASVLLYIFALLTFDSAKAQTHLHVGNLNYTQWMPLPIYQPIGNGSILDQKWHFNTYAAVSTGFGFFNGGNGTYISAPIGMQISRPLNNHLIAYAGISAGPTFYSFNRSVSNPALNSYYPGSSIPNAYGFGLNSRVEMGLMYINDAKTFSVSGSISVERSSYPVYTNDRGNIKKQ